MQIALALGERQAAQIDAVLMQQIERHEHQLSFVWVASTHLGHQAVEMRRAPWINQHQLAIEDRRSRGQLGERLAHAGRTIGVFGAVARVEADARAVLDDLEAEAIPFGFVQPIGAFGRADGCGRRQGADKRKA
jgi:hypothetical protein